MAFLPGLTLLHCLAFLLYWLTNQLFYASVNDFLAKAIKLQVDFVLIFMGISTVIGMWSLVRLILSWRGHKVGGRVFHSVVAVIYTLFFYGSFVVLFQQDPIQLTRLGQLVGYFRLLLDGLLLLGLAWLLRPLVKKARWVWLAPTAVLLIIWLGALFAPPGNVIQGNLPAKPKLTAHRGASMLAPENTLAAAKRAAALGVYTLEADIRISQDGVPFLMHDPTLARTTDVARVFPGREKERAETFTIKEVRSLIAGIWFVEKDPFGTVRSGLVSPQESALYRTERVPSLAEILTEVKNSRLNFIFDIGTPPNNHPYASTIFEICLKQIKDAGIDAQIWFLVDEGEVPLVKAAAPQMVLVAGVSGSQPLAAEALQKIGYQLVNSEYRLPEAAIKDYKQAGLRVNLWTVDELWQFSRLWMLGVDSITTNNSHTFAALNAPIFAISFPWYILLWTMIGLSSLIIVYIRKR